MLASDSCSKQAAHICIGSLVSHTLVRLRQLDGLRHAFAADALFWQVACSGWAAAASAALDSSQYGISLKVRAHATGACLTLKR